jgi:ankyrin repeat protein
MEAIMTAINSSSAILTAMYNRQRDEAVRLASAAPTLTVWEASALGDNDRLRELLDHDAALANAYAPDGFLPLGLAAFFAPAATTKLLLERGATVGVAARNSMKVQALHAAVAARNADAVRMLLDRGADPNARQQVGYTPLMGAASAGRADLTDLLLQRGADPSLLSEDGKTAADLARDHGYADLAERLIVRTRP